MGTPHCHGDTPLPAPTSGTGKFSQPLPFTFLSHGCRFLQNGYLTPINVPSALMGAQGHSIVLPGACPGDAVVPVWLRRCPSCWSSQLHTPSSIARGQGMPRSGALPHTGFALALRAALGRGLLVPTRATLAVLGEVTAWAQTPDQGTASAQHKATQTTPPSLPSSLLPPSHGLLAPQLTALPPSIRGALM